MACYQVTPGALAELWDLDFPGKAVARVGRLKNQRFAREKEFEVALDRVLDPLLREGELDREEFDRIKEAAKRESFLGWSAVHRFARIAPRKARPVLDMIRGRPVTVAENILRLTHKLSAVLIRKVLSSAAANANEAEADMEELVVAEARIDPGPTMKRFQPKDRGKAYPILKRFSHITIVVKERD
jgi:large subunit ribosomal protein L22